MAALLQAVRRTLSLQKDVSCLLATTGLRARLSTVSRELRLKLKVTVSHQPTANHTSGDGPLYLRFLSTREQLHSVQLKVLRLLYISDGSNPESAALNRPESAILVM